MRSKVSGSGRATRTRRALGLVAVERFVGRSFTQAQRARIQADGAGYRLPEELPEGGLRPGISTA